ncbi:N-acetyl-1-D-myo-inositol-2-amino-2-deoxy-alpha-D-glucopyranoside deacetylase [Saccharopolyspora antimicrobica]|uniref:1D-myo-inositol 2-acetamido-2-deoxy-alpha-D-glucopyranoside deacetylase n=1 Tax=Saccharopolyspora antimicrobica TaxID=455193 RepID=A0A1I4ZZE8_9PSEU|nr:N-acetyl-1-D-myo-inositol-2-amino-2-deoxy-alpha-D-glucopyranoside deacetylase [Saccharopolyspora antimicrobica]RKT83341.1 N-acetyl-1-D-myo-inositol-2-amino-2-deoxy-alpha-D-glucopyranoside deacetylase [Saccharopolyspora antimicrobica]SFN55419.1 N-acetyl-1-D-myo-inositol-2-amino-2-deoxy-alpha-D-glucopyranoside deacetylase [Saccharopolyspora antimicrobica]
MTLTAPPRLLLVHAHPDDESLWTGGTIARYAARGVQVVVVTCTLGEEGEVIPESLRGLAADQADQLGGYRVGELRSACAALHVTDHRFLGGIGRWRDSGMLWEQPGLASALPEAHPRAFATGAADEQVDALEAVLREVRPQVVVSYAADGGYGHPDHIRAHEVTVAAAAKVPEVQRVFYAVPSRDTLEKGLAALAEVEGMPFQLPEPHELASVADESISTVIDVSEHLPAKISALRAHGTQVKVWLDRWDNGAGVAAYALSNGVAQPIVPTEHYVLASGDPAGCEVDLFGGLGVSGTEPVGDR